MGRHRVRSRRGSIPSKLTPCPECHKIGLITWIGQVGQRVRCKACNHAWSGDDANKIYLLIHSNIHKKQRRQGLQRRVEKPINISILEPNFHDRHFDTKK